MSEFDARSGRALPRAVLHAETRWRGWPDGCVVFAPRSAQTCLLPAACTVLLQACESAPDRSFDYSLPDGVDVDAVIAHLVTIGAAERSR